MCRFYTGTPVFPFGYGIAYTTFTIKNNTDFTAQTLSTAAASTASAAYSVTVTNTGDVTGDEVVFAYFSPSQVPEVGAVQKQLFGFQRVHLAPGGSVCMYACMHVDGWMNE
eukprot:m.1369431 g.1369431  ORF g.1369431 m.1369431 type:complete len:111 (+) comp24955_c1_seq28:380-712(+)